MHVFLHLAMATSWETRVVKDVLETQKSVAVGFVLCHYGIKSIGQNGEALVKNDDRGSDKFTEDGPEVPNVAVHPGP